MNLLKRLLTSIELVQAAVLAILNLLAVFGVLSLTDIQLGALNLAILAIARAIAPVIYGKQLDELNVAVTERATEQVQAAVARQIPNEGIEGRTSLDNLLNGLLES